MLALEEHLDEPLAHPAQLSLRKRPEPVILSPTGQRIRDSRSRQDVRRSREQKLPRALVEVDALLDREQHIRYPLDLVDHDRRREIGDEPGGVSLRRGPRRAIVQRQASGGVLVPRIPPTNVLLPTWRAPSTTTTRVSVSARLHTGEHGGRGSARPLDDRTVWSGRSTELPPADRRKAIGPIDAIKPAQPARGLVETTDGSGCRSCPRTRGLRSDSAKKRPFAGLSRGDGRNRTGVDGFAGRCVATPPRRRKRPSRVAGPLLGLGSPRAISSAGRAPPRQGGGHWFEPSIAHREKALLMAGFLR
jgi:hypothetical protein